MRMVRFVKFFLMLSILALQTSTASAQGGERIGCEAQLVNSQVDRVGVDGNLIKQGVGLIRRRGGALTVPPENSSLAGDLKSGHSGFRIQIAREWMTDLLVRIVLSNNAQSAELFFANAGHPWSDAVVLPRTRQIYEDFEVAEARMDVYEGVAHVFGQKVEFAIQLRSARQEDDSPDYLTWRSSGSATVSVNRLPPQRDSSRAL